jgi:O-antigen/teichoic acid export membrane protein
VKIAKYIFARNLAANYLSATVVSLSTFIGIPVLVGALGVEHWGLVAFSNLLIAMMTMLNAGVSQALVREFAHRWSQPVGGGLAAGKLLRGYEVIYWFVAVAVAVCALPFSTVIADRWLNVNESIRDTALACVMLSFSMFIFILPMAVYRTVLVALNEHSKLATISIIANLTRLIGGIFVVILSKNVLYYLIFLILIAFLENMIMNVVAWRLMPMRRSALPFDLSEVRATLRFSASMSLLVVLGVATTQLDRVFVSGMLSVADLGTYSIAVSIAFGMLQLSYPLFTTVLPTLVVIGDDYQRRKSAIRRLLVTVITAATIIGTIYWAVGEEVLGLWLGNSDLASKVADPLTGLLVGVALNMVYNIGYTNWVSKGEVRWIALVNGLSFVLTLIVLPLAIPAYGLVGATSAYILINVIGAFTAMLWISGRDVAAARKLSR